MKLFQGNTNAIDSHLFDLLEAGQDWAEICDKKSDRTKLQPWQNIEIGATQLGFLKIFNHLVFKPTPAMNSIVYVERENVWKSVLDEKFKFFEQMVLY